MKFEHKLKNMLEGILKKAVLHSGKNGKYKEFNKQAELVAEGNYHNDVKHGLWRQYYDSGELLIEEDYENGILHGKYTAYHMNGQLMSAGQYVHGKREGYFDVYDEEGEPVKRMFFADNNLVKTFEKQPVQYTRA